MSFGTIGGLLMILGAFFTFKGEIFKSVTTYLTADVIWIAIALKHDDITGAVFITLGFILGFGAFIKMNSGKLRKTNR